MITHRLLLLGFWLLVANSVFFKASAADSLIKKWRVTSENTTDSSLANLILAMNAKLGTSLESADFLLAEKRTLATSNFESYIQIAEKLPIKGSSFRIWKSRDKNGELIQAEAHVEDLKNLKPLRQALASNYSTLGFEGRRLQTAKIYDLFSRVIRASRGDRFMGATSYEDHWVKGRILRGVKIQARRGTYQFEIDLEKMKIVSYRYLPFATADYLGYVYPIYEETDNSQMLRREYLPIKNLSEKVLRAPKDPFSVLNDREYLYSKLDSVLGSTTDGQAQGFWNFDFLFGRITKVRSTFPEQENSFSRGMILEGKYATVSLHAKLLEKFPGVDFVPQNGSQAQFIWSAVGGTDDWKVTPASALLGKPVLSEADFKNRNADRDPQHNPVKYINSGFDEIQVYYAINELMESLNAMGFKDPGLSESPFHAFLYDPDIESKDNAYYTNDTINFSTYSPAHQNFARDNTTIWHELGHGIMDRLMGARLQLADTGGLSEGMADFLATLVVEAKTQGQAFPGSNSMRIVNSTGFFLTNEVHDDGEAYGGAMKDMMDLSIKKYGRSGLSKITDLTLEAMRLTRDHPQLTAQEWFEHMLFADSRSSQFRRAGDCKDLIKSALSSRNFSFNEQLVAKFTLMADGAEVTGNAPGTRDNPIPVQLKKTEEKVYNLDLSLSESNTYKFQFPVTLEVSFNKGPLQGAIRWKEEALGAKTVTLASAKDAAAVTVTATGVCDFANRGNGDCVDFIYIKVLNKDNPQPVAKKRFYIHLENPEQ